jgi:drug/metabolite transporter (DMT)-like permease
MFFWAIDNNLSKSLTKSADLNSAKIVKLKSLLGGLILFAVTLSTGTDLYIEIEVLPIIIIISVLGFGGALFLFLEGLKHIGTVKTMSVFSLTPIFGIIVAATVLKESISVFQAIATGLIILGIFIISRR